MPLSRAISRSLLATSVLQLKLRSPNVHPNPAQSAKASLNSEA